MTVATRLLVASVGTGSFPARVLRTLTSSPQGGWTQIQAPKAMAYNGYTYFGWLNGSTGETQFAAWNNGTSTLSTPVTAHGSYGVTDNHASPACLVMASSHKLLTAYAAHDGATLYTRLSTSSLASDPTLSGGFAAEVTPRTAGDWTYANLLQLDSGTVFLFYRYYVPGTTTGYLEWVKSTDEGATWSGPTQIFASTTGHVGYWRIGSDGTKMHVITTETEPTVSSTFHFYMLEDGTLHKSDGTVITAPLHSTDCTAVLALGSGGANWSFGVSVDGSGRPASVMMQDITGDNRIVTARYRSGSWQVNTVVASVGGHLGTNQYASACAIHPTDPDIVYVAKKATKWEMWRYVSADDGVTWTGTQLTSSSAHDNVWADVVHKAGSGLEGIWLYGDYTSDLDYAFGVRGYG